MSWIWTAENECGTRWSIPRTPTYRKAACRSWRRSGLLFSEYRRYGYLNPIRFWVRRGFKIYPPFYAFLLVYLVGFFNLDTAQGTSQFGKGMFKFGVHFLFLIAGVSYLARRSERFYWQSVGVFCAGMVFNAAYVVVQLLAARDRPWQDATAAQVGLLPLGELVGILADELLGQLDLGHYGGFLSLVLRRSHATCRCPLGPCSGVTCLMGPTIWPIWPVFASPRCPVIA